MRNAQVSISWNWTETELGWEDSLTECLKGYENLHPRMSGLKETLELMGFGPLSVLENIYSTSSCQRAIYSLLEYATEKNFTLSHSTDMAEKTAGVNLDGVELFTR